MNRIRQGWLIGCVVAFGTTTAEAAGPKDRLGFRIGDKSKLHLGVLLSSTFDTNPNRGGQIITAQSVATGTDEGDSSDGQQDVRLLVRPTLGLDVPGRQFSLKLGAGATFSQFLGSGSSAESKTLFGFDTNLFARVGSKRSAIQFTLSNALVLTPTVLDDLGSIASDERAFPSLTDNGRAFFTFRPGGGALEFDLGYENNYTIFVDDADSLLDDGFNHVGFFESRLRFLPKTAVLFRFDAGWFAPARASQSVSPTLESNPYNVTLGLTGQITRTISMEARAGYGETLVWDRNSDRFGTLSPSNQRDFIALVAAKWQLLKTAALSVGYDRSLQPTVALSSFRSDAFRSEFTWGIDRLVLGAYGAYEIRTFGEQADDGENVDQDAPVGEPQANILIGGLRADYYFTDWLVGGLNFRVMDQSSNDEDRAAQIPVLGTFTRLQAFATVGIQY